MKLKFLLLFSVVFLAACTQGGQVSDVQEDMTDPDQQATSSMQDEQVVSDSMQDQQIISDDNSDTSAQVELASAELVPIAGDDRYVEYSPELAASLQEEGTPHVLFFYADWCSWCRRMHQDLTEQMDTFAEDAVVLRANFDKETELRQEYGVTVKDTYAFIGADGETVSVKSGATLDDLRDFFTSNEVSDEVVENPTGVAMYREYDPEVEETFIGKKPYALFFHATWCPSCKKVDGELTEALADLPSSVAVFKTDYDTNLDLRQEYGVTMQHTLVHFDANGELTEVLPGFTVEDVERVFTQ